MNRPRILIVEDRPSVLRMMVAVLERGHDVTTASDGTTALALVASEPFDVVLSDVRLPDATGFDLVRAVTGSGRSTPVVLITAFANVPDAVAAIKNGAYDYLSKPLDADEISLVVARAVESRQGADRGSDAAGVTTGEPVALSADAQAPITGFRRAVDDARDRASRAYLLELMDMFDGNVTHAATRAGMTRESLHRVLKKYGVHSEDYKADASAANEPMRATRTRT